jgi:hypothetical protein
VAVPNTTSVRSLVISRSRTCAKTLSRTTSRSSVASASTCHDSPCRVPRQAGVGRVAFTKVDVHEAGHGLLAVPVPESKRGADKVIGGCAICARGALCIIVEPVAGH